MSKRIQLRRGTTTEHNTFTGAPGEVTVDTTKDVLVVHDGTTVGGFPQAARANVDGTVSIVGKDGTLLSVFSTSTKLAEYTPIPYPKNTPPTGYLMLMGQSISSSTYPILYSLYGATLPDMRGEFIRGWDNGRGKDSGRSVLSSQGFALQNMTGSLGSVRTGSATPPLTGVFYLDGGAAGNITNSTGTGYPSIGFDASRVSQTATETRPTNVAFNYIVKAG